MRGLGVLRRPMRLFLKETWHYRGVNGYLYSNYTLQYKAGTTTPIMVMGCRQCLPLSVVQLKGKHCRKPHCRNGVVDMFGQWLRTLAVNLILQLLLSPWARNSTV